ncbi:MAG: Rieske (2Fe-2S) protein [Candidatus Bathyarchaeia archaeon]|jgi:3-phenylpropionate/trans-cinnamate dioxygenase ferredoxin subunit
MSSQSGFVPVLDENELQEGSMKLVSVEGVPVLLIKQSGQIFAIDNRCPHMGCAFSGGTLEGFLIVCPCHDWRFDLETGEYQDEPAIKLTSYEFKLKSGKIWIRLEEET